MRLAARHLVLHLRCGGLQGPPGPCTPAQGFPIPPTGVGCLWEPWPAIENPATGGIGFSGWPTSGSPIGPQGPMVWWQSGDEPSPRTPPSSRAARFRSPTGCAGASKFARPPARRCAVAAGGLMPSGQGNGLGRCGNRARPIDGELISRKGRYGIRSGRSGVRAPPRRGTRSEANRAGCGIPRTLDIHP